MVEITVFVKESPPKTNITIIVMTQGVVSIKRAATKKLIERNATPVVNTNREPFLSTSTPPIYPKIITLIAPGKIIPLPIVAVLNW